MKIKINGVLQDPPPPPPPPPNRTARLRPEERERLEALRLPNGRFPKGVSGFPGGSVRKAREDRYFIDALKDVFEGMGGVPAMLEWAQSHPTKFYEICSKTMPVQLQIEKDSIGHTIKIVHALPPPAYARGIEQGSTIEMVDPSNLSVEEVRDIVEKMDEQAKAALLAGMRAGGGNTP